MYAKSLFLAAALITLPATTTLAQSSAGQPTSSMPDTAAQPGAAAGTPMATTAPAGPIVPATAADLIPKAIVCDATGGKVGTIESVTSAGAVVFTGVARAQIPLGSFSKNAGGLVIGMTKAQLESAVAQASAKK